jgi:hypothetical protein
MVKKSSATSARSKSEKAPLDPRRFLIAKPNEAFIENISDQQPRNTLYTLDWTLGFYSKKSPQYKELRDLLLPDLEISSFDRDHFLNLLAFSFSLNIKEKRRVLRAFSDTGLSALQIKELINTFESEQTEFDKLFAKEESQICRLYFQSLDSWATLLWGPFQGRHKLNALLYDLIKEDRKIPYKFPRTEDFWMIAMDSAVSWSASSEIIQELLAKGESVSVDKPFALKIIDYLYKENIDLLENRLSYVWQRVSASQLCLSRTSLKPEHSVVVARAWAMGVCQDWALLGERSRALDAVSNAERAMEVVLKKPSALKSKSKEAIEHLKNSRIAILTWKLNIQSMFECAPNEIIETLRSLHDEENGAINTFGIDALYYQHQFLAASKYLHKKFLVMTDEGSSKPERLYSYEIADIAIELLLISNIAQEIGIRTEAAMFLIGFCQFHIYRSQPGAHEKKKLQCIYQAVQLLSWLELTSKNTDQTLINQISVAFKGILEKASNDIHPTSSDTTDSNVVASLRKLPPTYIAILGIDGAILNDPWKKKIWRQAVTDRRVMLQLLIVLFSLSSNEKIREYAQSFALDILENTERDLFGPALKKSFRPFTKFAAKLTYCNEKNLLSQKSNEWDLDFID